MFRKQIAEELATDFAAPARCDRKSAIQPLSRTPTSRLDSGSGWRRKPTPQQSVCLKAQSSSGHPHDRETPDGSPSMELPARLSPAWKRRYRARPARRGCAHGNCMVDDYRRGRPRRAPCETSRIEGLMSKPTAVVVGVGAERGLGAALCRGSPKAAITSSSPGGHRPDRQSRGVYCSCGRESEPIAMDATRESHVQDYSSGQWPATTVSIRRSSSYRTRATISASTSAS